MNIEPKQLNKKITYKSCLMAGAVLLGLSFGTAIHASTTDETNASTNTTSMAVTSSTAESDATQVASEMASSANSSTTSEVAVSSTNSSNATVVTDVSSSQVVSTSNVQSATVSSNVASAPVSDQSTSQVTTTNLGNASSEEVESAKSAAQAAYESTGVAQKITAQDATSINNGWTNEGNTKVFYKNGQKANGYINDGTNWYLFKNGLRQSDVQKWAGTYYYFDHSTFLRTDNAYVKANWGSWYLFGNDGRILTDVQKWAGTYYYFDHYTFLRTDNAYVKSNWGNWYMFGNEGRIVSGLCYWAGSYYYFNPSTYLKAVNTTINIDGQNYKFDGSGIATNRTQLINKLIAVVKGQLGKPYVYGASGPNAFDCSGLVQYAYKQIGITLPRTTTGQQNVGTAISLSSVQVGDLLFWGNYGSPYHVAIYVGNGQVIMAPKTNTVIRAEAMSDWMPTFARRVL